ncbi:uncharacterized protein LOC110447601 [Mizuhopecten yessoensis]|uniref:uncharacterized protein LOC110447601 n=1 Tax=Mizuhopecten yessoensis TaxID=6573 RepID=UPI000B45CD8B|nr:uncharacterized protein LOC110447601 [Mizuhopecten yessoensis]
MSLDIISCKHVDKNGSSTRLPLWCYNPDGTKCSWYRQCLEKRYPCEQTGSAYAITYAEKFCDLYAKNVHMFSTYGRQWIAASKKCLQVVLAPVLSPEVNISCSDIKSMAFASHPKCYSNPSEGFSFCSLSLRDKLEVFWTIKEALLSAFEETVKAAWATVLDCLKVGTD